MDVCARWTKASKIILLVITLGSVITLAFLEPMQTFWVFMTLYFGTGLVFMPYLLIFTAARPWPRCPTCNYDLHGINEGKCSECGREFRFPAR